MAKDKVGRPTVMTEEIVKKLEHAFVIGCTDIEACLYAGISRQTLYNYQEKHPEFIDRKEELKESLSLKARNNLAQSINSGNKEDSKWFLERKKKKEFSTRNEHTGADGQPMKAQVSWITDE